MIKNLFSDKTRGGSFFRRIDWSAFWAATIIALLVYFITLGPSVSLEDSGELAVAGDHLGVPHPPGYPIWTMCAWLFVRIFSFVTFRGQPTPAWSISLMSAFFGALAAGITAMLITRSASDIMRDAHDADPDYKQRENDWLCWAGGVSGSLVFAFSPVMWSQATIVEVYTLNAFFLMWIFLLTYRWMRKPSSRILWLTAFVFGLGMTNYQVLLLAALPLVVVIFLRNIRLFRDFLLLGIPVLLTSHVLQIGAMLPAAAGSHSVAFAKSAPLLNTAIPSMGMLGAGVVFIFIALALFLLGGFLKSKDISEQESSKDKTKQFVLRTFIADQGGYLGAGIALLGALSILTSCYSNKVVAVSLLDAPLAAPSLYTSVAALVVATIAFSLAGAYYYRGSLKEQRILGPLMAAGVTLAILLLRLTAVKSAVMPPQYLGIAFDWSLPTLILVGGIAVLIALSLTVERGVFYALPVAAVQLAAFVLLRKGAMNGLYHPTTWWFWWPIIWNFVVIALAWILLPNGRTTALTMLFAELGVSFYIYMPIVSDLRNPPMNWGYPRTWEGFKHAITRGQYEKISPANVFNKNFIFQLASYFTDMRVQFTMLVAPLGFVPFTLWSVKSGVRRLRALYVAAVLFVTTFVLVLISYITDTEVFLRLDKLLVGLILVLFVIGFAAIGRQQIEDFVVKMWQRHNLSEGVTVGITFAGLFAAAVLFVTKGMLHFLAEGGEASGGQKIAALMLSMVVVILLGVTMVLIGRLAQKHLDFRVDMDDVTQQWMLAVASGFFVMSVLLVVLANIKGDLQDNFIQKVKFISSHALFALWVGYGLTFGMVIAYRILKSMVRAGKVARAALVPVRVALCCIGMSAALIPIYENYNNDYLVFSMSGAEQNDHDFGWQFGNYQLRGAHAVTEELEADEEPLPNPVYPPRMTDNAIFYGGTDPGRFVPTYMIYSAQVRSDVFLITQNALADNTYMNTMRDLYGNDIWIPSPEDSAKAFQIYVDEVQAGKRAANADLTIDNGRVQVSGALGVMEINGILCDMMFAKNKSRHDFYIEESYVIRWMYPYLTPHGLIMKINSEQVKLSKELMQDDMDFWDWYTRRLVRGYTFRRDLPAQKSFSKLRSAIAGLYAATGLQKEAEEAYREARLLYPLSPEASFRMLQEVVLPQARYDEAEDVLKYFVEKDPNNTRAVHFYGFVTNVNVTQKRILELIKKGQVDQKLATDDVFELAMAYRQIGQNQSAAHYLKRLVDMGVASLPAQKRLDVALTLSELKQHADAVKAMDPLLHSMPPGTSLEILLRVADLYQDAQQMDQSAAVLMMILKANPNHWPSWVNMASIYLAKGQSQQFQYAVQKAVSIGQGAALQSIEKNPVLKKAALPIVQQMMQRSTPALPGVGLR
ncbi:MAG: DUF2723 domain-containing protein [Kiritimatiellia bacterium]